MIGIGAGVEPGGLCYPHNQQQFRIDFSIKACRKHCAGRVDGVSRRFDSVSRDRRGVGGIGELSRRPRAGAKLGDIGIGIGSGPGGVCCEDEE